MAAFVSSNSACQSCNKGEHTTKKSFFTSFQQSSVFLWTVPDYPDQTQSSRRAGPWLLQLEPPACAAVPRWHPHSRKKQLSQLDFLNFRVTVNNLEHELRDEGGSNCRLLHFLLPAAPWELFYWPIRLGKSPAGGRPALPKSASGAGLSAASRGLRLPGCHHSCPQPQGWFKHFRPRALTVFSTVSPGDLRACSSPFLQYIDLECCFCCKSSLAAVSAPDGIASSKEPSSHSRICCETSVHSNPNPSFTPPGLAEEWMSRQHDPGVETEERPPAAPTAPMPLLRLFPPTPCQCLLQKKLFLSRWPDVNARKWHSPWKYPVVYNTQPRPGPLPINKSRSISSLPLLVLDSVPFLAAAEDGFIKERKLQWQQMADK